MARCLSLMSSFFGAVFAIVFAVGMLELANRVMADEPLGRRPAMEGCGQIFFEQCPAYGNCGGDLLCCACEYNGEDGCACQPYDNCPTPQGEISECE
jgi:hypothetical protein